MVLQGRFYLVFLGSTGPTFWGHLTTIKKVKKIGQRRWKSESGYDRQARIENAFFRSKTIIGDRLRARTMSAQATEAVLACNILNRMTALGQSASYAIEG